MTMHPSPPSSDSAVAAPPMRTDKLGLKRWACVIVLFLGVTAVFWRSVWCGFVFDDADVITRNLLVQKGLTWEGVRWALLSLEMGYPMPLSWLSWMLDVELFGTNPAGFHAVNVVLHGLCAAGLVIVLHFATGSFWRSFLVGALFAIHPLRVETVTWIAERKDVLSALLGFAALGAYFTYARRPSVLRYLLMLGLFVLSLLAKPTLVTLPFALLLLDFWPLGRLRLGQQFNESDGRAPLAPVAWWKLLLEKLPLLALSAACSIFALVGQAKLGVVQSLATDTPAERLANVIVSYVRYLGKHFWFGNLSAHYPRQNWSAGEVVPAALLLLVLSGLAIYSWKRRPWIFVGWFWYLGVFVPMIGLISFSEFAMADRFSYLPVIGLLIAIFWSLPSSIIEPGRRRMASGAIFVVLLSVLSYFTFQQIRVWDSNITLFAHAARVTTNNALAHANLGTEYAKVGDLEKATWHSRQAIGFEPAQYSANNTLGQILLNQGRVEESLPYLEVAVRNNKRPVAALNNLGVAYHKLGRFEEAAGCYQRALQLDPRFPDTHNNLANTLTQLGQMEQAESHYAQALGWKPGYAEAHYNWARLLERKGDWPRAAEQWRAARDVNANLPEIDARLGRALMRAGKLTDAVAPLERAIAIRSDDWQSHFDLGVCLLNTQQPQRAASVLGRLIAAKPELPEAHNSMGIALAQMGQLAEARDSFARALALRPDDADAQRNLARANAKLNEAAPAPAPAQP